MSKEEEGLNEVGENFSSYPSEFETSDDNKLQNDVIVYTDDDLAALLENHLKKEHLELGLESEWSAITEEENKFNPSCSTQMISSNSAGEVPHVSRNRRGRKRRKTKIIKQKVVKVKKQEMKVEEIDEKTELINLLSVIDESLALIEHQMAVLLDIQYKMYMLQDSLLKKNNDEDRNTISNIDIRNNELRVSRDHCYFDFFPQFKAPYFKDFHNFSCPRNTDCLEFIRTYPYKHYQPWSNFDVLHLQNCVREVIVKTYLSIEKKNRKNAFDVDYGTKLECLQTINYFKKEPLSSFLTKEMENNLDWLTVSELMKFKFDPNECKKMWNLFSKPSICKTKWSENEVNKLKQLAEIHESQNWETIASELGTSRSGFQCFLYFLKFLHKENYGGWTQEEVDFLNHLVSESTYGNKICWSKVSYYIENKNFRQIFCKWTNGTNPNLKKGQFKHKEDQLLLTLIYKFNLDFEEMAKVIKNRTATQLRERYLNSLNPHAPLKVGEWTEEEDKLLLKLVSELGERRWSAIANKLKSRNRTQVRHRYTCLLKKKMVNPDLELSHLKRYKRSTKSKKKLESTRAFIRNLKRMKNKKVNLSNINKFVDSVYKRKTKLTQVDLDLVQFFARELNTDMLNLDEVKNVSDYSLGTLTEEIINVLTVLKADLKFDERVLRKLVQEAESNSLGKCGIQIVNLLQENFLAKRIFNKQHQSTSSNDSLNLLPPNFNTLYYLWLMLDTCRRRSKQEYTITFNKDNFTPEDLALLNWHSRLHSLFIWPTILSLNKCTKIE